MLDTVSRLRMFAGPNGSGKSTLKTVLRSELWGLYVNPDEIEKEIKRFDFLDFSAYDLKVELKAQELPHCFIKALAPSFDLKIGG